jgi:hypothetical protein
MSSGAGSLAGWHNCCFVVCEDMCQVLFIEVFLSDDVRLRLQNLTVVPNAEVVERGTKKTDWRKCSTNALDRWAQSYASREIVLQDGDIR